MRTLTPTLLAAQRALGGVPSLLARVEDRERRWAPLLDADTSSRPTAACTTASGIVRARISAAGSVDVQHITSPGTTSQWQAWSTLVAGACPDSAVALAGVTGTDRVRLFFTRPSGVFRSFIGVSNRLVCFFPQDWHFRYRMSFLTPRYPSLTRACTAGSVTQR